MKRGKSLCILFPCHNIGIILLIGRCSWLKKKSGSSPSFFFGAAFCTQVVLFDQTIPFFLPVWALVSIRYPDYKRWTIILKKASCLQQSVPLYCYSLCQKPGFSNCNSGPILGRADKPISDLNGVKVAMKSKTKTSWPWSAVGRMNRCIFCIMLQGCE